MATNAIALKLVQYIADKNMQVGAKLPPIRELAAILECNQSQLRSGLITLSALGVVDMHPRAGSFIKRLSPSDLDTLFLLFFRFGMPGEQTDVANAYSVKRLLDKEIFINAVKYRTPNDLFHLEENLAKQAASISDIEAFIATDEEFHRYLAQIIRNPLLVFFQDAILVIIRPYRRKNLTPEVNQESYGSHVKLYEAIKAQNQEEVEKLAVLHSMARLNRLKENGESRGYQG
ncbi:MAG: FCD domain-containing protein [Treponemataceae bacterium]